MMTPDEMIEVIQAFKEGKRIEVRLAGKWLTAAEPLWNFYAYEYRVALQPVKVETLILLSSDSTFAYIAGDSSKTNLKLTFVENKLVGAEVIDK